MVAIIGGTPARFRRLVDLYREAGARAGHSPETLRVGIHALGYVADTTRAAIDEFYPGYAYTFTQAGKERGWPPVTRAQFDQLRAPDGALIVGNPDEVAAKVRHYDEALGGIARLNFQMSVAGLPHAQLMHAIELLGSEVSARLRAQPVA